ncbi:MAG TPA: type I glutamate--ammonia ligase [Candidatus Nanoarchaeia archaeon]|nr:type I glutamate--ammonia ligase [Candidatus Nanoarchaeia archaeon]
MTTFASAEKDLPYLRGWAQNNKLEFVYRTVLDIYGRQAGSFQLPIELLSEDVTYGFDGSSLTGYKAINESDMKMILLPKTAFMDRTEKDRAKLRILARVEDPISGKRYNRDPMNIAMRAAEYLKETGIADVAYFGPEAEFFVFDNVSFDRQSHRAHFAIDSDEGIWNAGRPGENKAYHPKTKGGYAPPAPIDSLENLREDIMRELIFNGIKAEIGHHEVATAGQCEIDVKYAELVTMANQLSWFKQTVKRVAQAYGKTATFMPKPITGDNGSGMHVHQSLWDGDKPLFAGDGYAGLSELALHYIGGILKHGAALCAITNPTTNSYKRLVPHAEAPTNLVYSARNRSAAIRIPQYEPGNPKATRIEVRFPDPLASGHLAFSAMLMAGLDGIQNKIDPEKPFEDNVYESNAQLRNLPGSLDETLSALDKDREFLKKGDVFTDDFIDEWIRLKRAEVQEERLAPTPSEFLRYYTD